MNYSNIKEAIFISRLNRFVAQIEIAGKKEDCHVKNTGRCQELLIPGAKTFVQEAENPNRKTKFDLISVFKGENLVNIDSQAPNKVFEEWIKAGNFGKEIRLIKPEYTFLDSRLDFYLETASRRILVETKGVTLEEEGLALFPDAPTARGIKHIEALINSLEFDYHPYLIFIIQMKGVRHFAPNKKTHPTFSDALKKAKEKGTNIWAMDCQVTKDTISLDEPIPIIL